MIKNKRSISRYSKRNVSIFIGSQITSLFGSSIVDYAILWYITLQTKSAMIMAIGTVCVFFPKMGISLFSGLWADRYNRKRIIIYSDIGIAFVTLIFAIVFYCKYQELWVIFLTLGIRSIGTGIQTPASNSIIPLIAPEDNYIQINGIYNSFQSIIAIVSPALSGVLLSYYPLEIVVMTDIITALIAMGILSRLKFDFEGDKISDKSYVKNVSISWRYINSNHIVNSLLRIYSLYFFLIVPISLLSPIKIVRLFGDEVWRLSISEICMSMGSVLGGMIMAKYGKITYGFKIIGGSFIVIGIFMFLMTSSCFKIFLGAIFTIGTFISLSNSSTVSLLQINTEKNFQGRVFGLVQIFITGTNLLGMILFGVLGDVINIDIIFYFISILFVLLGVYVYKSISMQKK
ncbi:MFS transporter [Porphyromonas gingivalis]|uniref:MFS transporter n=1 Tax=Porphyromonas gingivalis TaxID=837 RepID=UPI000C1A0F54|nr:MFS transporter [Porphyromonas gingivalis]ATR99617.1 hypothetical protein CS549_00045 [Porphyromonas gingivalis]